MIRIRLDELTLGRVRIAVSPLWEAMSSLALTLRYRSEMPFPYAKWAKKALSRVSPDLHRGVGGDGAGPVGESVILFPHSDPNRAHADHRG